MYIHRIYTWCGLNKPSKIRVYVVWFSSSQLHINKLCNTTDTCILWEKNIYSTLPPYTSCHRPQIVFVCGCKRVLCNATPLSKKSSSESKICLIFNYKSNASMWNSRVMRFHPNLTMYLFLSKNRTPSCLFMSPTRPAAKWIFIIIIYFPVFFKNHQRSLYNKNE